MSVPVSDSADLIVSGPGSGGGTTTVTFECQQCSFRTKNYHSLWRKHMLLEGHQDKARERVKFLEFKTKKRSVVAFGLSAVKPKDVLKYFGDLAVVTDFLFWKERPDFCILTFVHGKFRDSILIGSHVVRGRKVFLRALDEIPEAEWISICPYAAQPPEIDVDSGEEGNDDPFRESSEDEIISDSETHESMSTHSSSWNHTTHISNITPRAPCPPVVSSSRGNAHNPGSNRDTEFQIQKTLANIKKEKHSDDSSSEVGRDRVQANDESKESSEDEMMSDNGTHENISTHSGSNANENDTMNSTKAHPLVSSSIANGIQFKKTLANIKTEKDCPDSDNPPLSCTVDIPNGPDQGPVRRTKRKKIQDFNIQFLLNKKLTRLVLNRESNAPVILRAWLDAFEHFNHVVWPACFGIQLFTLPDATPTSKTEAWELSMGPLKGVVINPGKFDCIKGNLSKNKRKSTFESLSEQLSVAMKNRIQPFPEISSNTASNEKIFSFKCQVKGRSNSTGTILMNFTNVIYYDDRGDQQKQDFRKTLTSLYKDLWDDFSTTRILRKFANPPTV